MRIEAFDCDAFGPQNNWVCETMTTADAISHLMGLAEIDVIEDVIARKEPVRELPKGKTQYWIQRRIRGRVVQRLRLWDAKSREFGKGPILGGIRLPDEDRVYITGQVSISFDENENVLEILAGDTRHE